MIIKGELGYCPQQVILNETLTVSQHLEYFAAAYRLKDLEYAQGLVGRLGFLEYIDRRVDELSGGTQQKLNLTIALMHHPAILLLDEPYQGFDWDTYLKFWDLADGLRKEGCCLIVISHLLFERNRFDSIYKLSEGRLSLESATTVPHQDVRP